MQAPFAADMRLRAMLPLASTTNNTRAPGGGGEAGERVRKVAQGLGAGGLRQGYSMLVPPIQCLASQCCQCLHMHVCLRTC